MMYDNEQQAKNITRPKRWEGAKETEENLIIKQERGTPLEFLAYNLPKQALMVLALGLIALLAPIGLLIIQYLQLNAMPSTNELIPLMGYIVAGFVFFLQAFIVYKSVIKRGENVLIKEMRGGQTVFGKSKVGKPIYFNKRDKTTLQNILWNGAGTAEHSGAKVLLLKEGSSSNENINLCVAESDWTKNLSSMVKAKTFADLAESELLGNKGLLGLKWQDIVLIIIAVGIIGIAGLMLGVIPNMVAEEVMQALTGGALQNALQSIVAPVVV